MAGRGRDKSQPSSEDLHSAEYGRRILNTVSTRCNITHGYWQKKILKERVMHFVCTAITMPPAPVRSCHHLLGSVCTVKLRGSALTRNRLPTIAWCQCVCSCFGWTHVTSQFGAHIPGSPGTVRVFARTVQAPFGNSPCDESNLRPSVAISP